MRRKLQLIVIGLVSIAMLAGCGMSSDDASALKDKLESVKESVSEDKAEDNESGSKKKKKKDDDEEKTAKVPKYCIDGPGDVECDTIHVIDEDGSYKKLSEALEKLNNDFVVSAYDNGVDDPSLINVEQHVYVRRTDAGIFSFAHEYRESHDEGDYVRMRGYTFLTDSGKELELSDVVKDETAFYKLLSKELYTVVMKDMRLYAADIDIADFDADSAMQDCIDNQRYGWVLDPQGVTFWFENVNAMIGHVCVSVLFSADKDGTIFAPEYADSAPDEWIMQIPGNYSQTVFDCDDNKTADTIEWAASTFATEGYESGIDVNYNDRFFMAGEICDLEESPYWSRIYAFLMHKDKKTLLVVHYYLEAESLWDTYTLENDMVERVDTVYAYPEYENYKEDASGWLVPTDMSAIPVYSDHGGDEITVYPDEKLCIEINGKMKVSEVSDDADTSKKSSKKSEKSDKKSGISKEDAAEIADNIGGRVCVMEYHDYDYDGASEAFVVIGENDEYNGYLPKEIWFISSEGKTIMVRDVFNDMSLYTENDSYYMDYEEENRGFFYGDCGGYGSGWITFIFSVKDGMPYELDISMKTEGFYKDGPGKYYTLTDNFDDGHAYLITELIYNSKTGEFEKGRITDEDWLDR